MSLAISRISFSRLARKWPILWREEPLLRFAAIDFETADNLRNSACAVALVRVEEGDIVAREVRLIRPPRLTFRFTYIHGIGPDDVRDAPPFREVWREFTPVLDGLEFLCAHNASFDRSVLQACCQSSRLRPPPTPFLCTVRLARRVWNLRPTRLPDVCNYLDIPLVHHDPASDAEASARIVLAAARELGAPAIRRLVSQGVRPSV